MTTQPCPKCSDLLVSARVFTRNGEQPREIDPDDARTYALSRKDSSIKICTLCGKAEALMDMASIPTFIMARKSIEQDFQESRRLDGAPCGVLGVRAPASERIT